MESKVFQLSYSLSKSNLLLKFNFRHGEKNTVYLGDKTTDAIVHETLKKSQPLEKVMTCEE